jgi:hypothetical protein
MTKPKPKHLHKKAGQPSPYKEEYNKMAEIACLEGGFTDKKLAKLFGVCEATIYNWKNSHPEFLEAIKRGKDAFDVSTAEDCLQKRIKGYSYTEVTQEASPLTGNLEITKKVTKKVGPDPKSLIFFLTNRNPERWPGTKRVEHSIDKDTISHAEKLAAARRRKVKE